MFGQEKPSNRVVGQNANFKVILTGGQIHDSEPAIELFDNIEIAGKKILADKAYSSEQLRVFLAEHGAVACIMSPGMMDFRS